MTPSYRLGDLAREVGGEVRGDEDRPVRGIATLGDAGPDDLSFLTNPRYRKDAESTRAGALLVGKGSGLKGRDLLEASEPYVALARLLALFHPAPPARPGVSADARIGTDVRMRTMSWSTDLFGGRPRLDAPTP